MILCVSIYVDVHLVMNEYCALMKDIVCCALGTELDT